MQLSPTLLHQAATHTHTHKCSLKSTKVAINTFSKRGHTPSVSGLHANGSVQSDDLAVNHGVLSQRYHQVGKLRGVSQARGEGHLSGEKGSHLLWEAGQEGGGEQTYGNKERQHLRFIHRGQIPPGQSPRSVKRRRWTNCVILEPTSD